MTKKNSLAQVIKTKTEISTIMDFLDWLEKVKGEKDGVILLYHDQPKLAPYMLIENMKKFNLFDRFTKTVKGFVNGYDLNNFAEKGKGLKYLTLSANYKVHADQLAMDVKEPEDFEGNAAVRAKLSYEICKLMSYDGEKKEDVDEKQMQEMMNKFITAKAYPIDSELTELVEMEESISRQTDMRDIFLGYFSASRYHRKRALFFRKALADLKHDKSTLQEIWNNGKREGLEAVVKNLESLKEDVEREELVNILEHHFDEEKKPLKPLVRNNNNRRRNPRMHNKDERRQRSNSNRRQPRQNRNGGGRRMSHRDEMNSKTGMVHKDQQQEYEKNNMAAAAAN